MCRFVYNSNLPKWLKILIYIAITITLVYWLGLLVYEFLEALRKLLHWTSEQRNWWTFLTCIFILGIGSLLIAQFALGLDPFGKIVKWFIDRWNDLRQLIGDKIAGQEVFIMCGT